MHKDKNKYKQDMHNHKIRIYTKYNKQETREIERRKDL